MQYVNFTGLDTGSPPLAFGVTGSTTTLGIVQADNLEVRAASGSTREAVRVRTFAGGSIVTLTNSTILGPDGSDVQTQDFRIFGGSRLQCSNCTFNTVGFDGPTGWVVSRDHNRVLNDWKIYGQLNSTDANNTFGLMAANFTSATNLTLMNGTVYSVAFPTAYNISESATVGNITVKSGNLNITGAVNVTITQNLTSQQNSYFNNITINADNVTVWNQTTISANTNFTISGEKANSTFIIGTPTRAGTIINNGYLRFTANTGSNVPEVNGADNSYQFAATGNNWGWDDGGSGSKVNTKWGDIQFDATTGGGGVTVNFTGNMTIDAFTISGGDTLNITTPGTTVTGATTKTIALNGAANLLGSSSANVTMQNYDTLTMGGVMNLQYLLLNNTGSDTNNFNIQITTGTFKQFDRVYAYSNSQAALSTSFSLAGVTNSFFDNTNEGPTYLRRDIRLTTNVNYQFENTTFQTVGMDGDSGWLISKNHNNVTNDWRIYGNLNSSDANSSLGYRAANWTSSTNITLMNATTYLTAFPTTYNISESATVGNITIQSGNLNISGPINVTITNNLTTQAGSANSNISIDADNITVWNQTTINSGGTLYLSRKVRTPTFII